MAVEKVVDGIIESGAIEKVLERIDILALKLGTTVEHLWEILVKQAYVTFIGYGIRYILAIIFLCCMCKYFPYIYKKVTHKDYNPECPAGMFSMMTFMVCCVITIVCLVATIGELTYFISLYVNPEYFAFQKIADFIY